ncbi:MAG: hypothetical protein ACR2JR_15770 [Rubrobacteraceae bacterium]
MIDQFADHGPERTTPESRRLLDEQVKHIEEAGGTVAGAHLRLERPDDQIVEVGEELGAGLTVMGNRAQRGEEGAYGERLRLRRQARPLPRPGGPLLKGNSCQRPATSNLLDPCFYKTMRQGSWLVAGVGLARGAVLIGA